MIGGEFDTIRGGVIRVEVRYTGRVQGVGFRATASAIARSIGVQGWVRNEDDGSVSLVAEGRQEEVEQLLEALADRMAGLIRSVERVRSVPRGEQGFTIRR